jgi:RHS repeat-associated protein
VDANTVRTEYGYDDLGRRVIVTNNQNQVSQTVYDKIGNIIAEITPLQHRTEYRYDKRDRKIAVIDARYTVLPAAQQEFTSYVYDKVGNMLSITDPVDNTTSYQYDALNRLTVETNQFSKSRTYSYDAEGNRIKAVDRNGRVRVMEYDGWNQMNAEKWLDSGNVAIKTIASHYNAAGELVQIGDEVSQYAYSYDFLGRLKTVDNAGTPGVTPVKFTYGYDNEGNITSVTDAIAGVTKVTTAYDYDELDRLTMIRQSGVGISNKRVDISYDQIGLLEKIDRFTGLDGTGRVATTNYRYDHLNRLEQIKHQNAANTILEELNYRYDTDNRIATITDLDGLANYSYLADNQLASVDYTDARPDEAYNYDANGNRTNAGYQTGINNQLSTFGAYIYTYDDEGNLLTQAGNGVTRSYVWDYRNRLISVTDTAGLAVSYGYDISNKRIFKVALGVTTSYVYDRGHISMEFRDGGIETSVRYLYGQVLDQVFAQDKGNNNISWFVTDYLGSVTALVGNDGSVRNSFSYDSFGNFKSTIGVPLDDSDYKYAAREFDTVIGLYYNRARYYSSTTGRFTSVDPITFASKDTNLYRYAWNNPIHITDPTGKAGRVVEQTREVKVRVRGLRGDTTARFLNEGISSVEDVYNNKRTENEDGEVPRSEFEILSDFTQAVIGESDAVNGEAGSNRTSQPYGGKIPGGVDDNGHIVPAILGGRNQRFNMFAQHRTINRGVYNMYSQDVNRHLSDNPFANRRGIGVCVNALLYTVNLQFDGTYNYTPELAMRPSGMSVGAVFTDGTVIPGYYLNLPSLYVR